MLYYHGTPESFRFFDLTKAEDFKDFGKGIYLSEEFWHAELIAKKRNKSNAYVMEYDLNIDDMRKHLKIKEFKKTSIPWVDFLILNRNRKVEPEYDVIIGGTADAEAQTLLEGFYRRHKTRKPTRKDYRELIVRLVVHKYPRQICLATPKAVDYVNSKYVKTHKIY